MQKIILIVDDLLMIHRIIGQILTDAGYKVLKAENGKKGYEMTMTWKPDLVIMDIEMPVMNGIEATKMIKSAPAISHIPVVILTSLGSEEDRENAKKAGADYFLNKPISKDSLLEIVKNILHKE
ncbi:response regulator [hot springs metagenome]|uniref:Response regulator n=1 Tax=hot springs metagenome TaxID=433727 RepID=A0A5J4L564_9ZZZZ